MKSRSVWCGSSGPVRWTRQAAPTGRVLLCLLATLAPMLLGGCDSASQPSLVPVPEETAPTSDLGPVATVSGVPTGTPTEASVPISLTLWGPEEYWLEGSGGEIWKEAVDAFVERHPTWAVQYKPKKPYGLGGVLSLLLTTGAVTASRLPDMVLIDTREIGRAVEAGLLQPLSGLVHQDVVDDLYPFAQEAGRHNGRLYAVPFGVDTSFAVYDSASLEGAPTTWTGVLTDVVVYAFPAGSPGDAASDALFIQCLGIQEEQWSVDGDSVLSRRRLTQALGFYWDGMNRGAIPLGVLDVDSLSESWASLKNGNANLVHVDSRQYTQERYAYPSARYTSIPTADGRPAILASTWAWAIVTEDPVRQEALAALVTGLMDRRTLGRWSKASGHLPARRSALPLAVEDADYRVFLQEQLEAARHYPSLLAYEVVSRTLQMAVRDVLRGSATPAEAASAAVTAIQSLEGSR